MSEEMSVILNVVAILATKAEFLWNVSRIGDRIGRNYEPCQSKYFNQDLWQVSFVLNELNVGRSAVRCGKLFIMLIRKIRVSC